MEVSIQNRVFKKIKQFYYNAMLKYPNTYFPEDADRDWDKISDEVSKVGTGLRKINPSTTFIVQEWLTKGYKIDFAKIGKTGWYFAYIIEGSTIVVCDAINSRNMSNNANNHIYKTNQKQQKNQQNKPIFKQTQQNTIQQTQQNFNNPQIQFVTDNKIRISRVLIEHMIKDVIAELKKHRVL